MTSRILFVESSPVQFSLERLDLEAIKRGFSDLFDRAAERVFRLGLDLDDVTIERFMDCRIADGERHRVEDPSISDVVRLRNGIVAQIELVAGGSLSAGGVTIVTLGVEVLSDADGRG